MTLTPAVTSVPGQTIHLRHLLGDADSSGRVNATDRSRVVSAWTGAGGFRCETDFNLDGTTNATDRSLVISVWTGPSNTAP